MRHLTDQQQQELKKIKQKGEYNRKKQYGRRSNGNDNGCRRETLWTVLHTGLLMYGTTCFKAKYITKTYDHYGHTIRRYARYQDIPLSSGEVINAIKYGIQHQLLWKDHQSRGGLWRLANNTGKLGGGEK